MAMLRSDYKGNRPAGIAQWRGARVKTKEKLD